VKTRLPLGVMVMTQNATDTVSYADAMAALGRHEAGDWGDVDASDWAANDWSLLNGERILSSYRDSNGIAFWIITERDRSATTILLPEDY
jgi:hypothetical protein